jgi:cell division protein FtsL
MFNVATALRGETEGQGLLKSQRVEGSSLRKRRRFFFSALLLGLCLFGLALLHVWLRLQVVHLGYVLSTANKLQSQLEQENRELKVELATLSSPDRLGEIVRARLGMGEPQKGQVVILP